MAYYVRNSEGVVQHMGPQTECEQYIRNASALFGVKGLAVYRKVKGKWEKV
jgi:hypothetical protein